MGKVEILLQDRIYYFADGEIYIYNANEIEWFSNGESMLRTLDGRYFIVKNDYLAIEITLIE